MTSYSSSLLSHFNKMTQVQQLVQKRQCFLTKADEASLLLELRKRPTMNQITLKNHDFQFNRSTSSDVNSSDKPSSGRMYTAASYSVKTTEKALRTKSISVVTSSYFLPTLRILLSYKNLSSIMSWMPDGKSWKIHDQYAFVEEILHIFFEYLDSYNEFIQLLSLCGFKTLCDPSLNLFFCESFVRNDVKKSACDSGIKRSRSLAQSGLVKPVPEYKRRRPLFY
uniref:HSF-type DNA-binding domain-containing protein n=1 Tax=Corethron hystrix TaxID=216773 RepID=A0A7S1FVH5_9STRA|mmetsp:Transcript_32668/g.75193  ORF Transcript_32668/g.75193 Transcript_32668/m.75193 type:complete len:224 (+) Transcript_32668:213-884(+)